MNNILETAGRLASNVCPELVASQPLYIIDSSSIEAGAFVRCDCYGLALPLMLAPQIRDLVGAKWTGPGPVVLLDLAAIELDARPGCTEQCTLSICLHEFAHLLPYRPVSILPDTDEIRAACAELVEADNAAPPPLPEDDLSHDWRFIRKYMHLLVRASALGYPVHVRDGWSTFALTYMCAERYLEIVEPEARAMLAWSFDQIEAAPPPQGLLDQYGNDLALLARFRDPRYGQ